MPSRTASRARPVRSSGWKVGARTPTAEPNPAPLLAGALVKSPARFDGKAMHMIGVEIEISFHIVRDIAARGEPVGRDEALAAVGDAFVGMEVVDTRLADFKQADPEWLLADNQMNHALVVGDSDAGLEEARLGQPAGEARRSTARSMSIRRAASAPSIRCGRSPG